eukprot:188863_1
MVAWLVFLLLITVSDGSVAKLKGVTTDDGFITFEKKNHYYRKITLKYKKDGSNKEYTRKLGLLRGDRIKFYKSNGDVSHWVTLKNPQEIGMGSKPAWILHARPNTPVHSASGIAYTWLDSPVHTNHDTNNVKKLIQKWLVSDGHTIGAPQILNAEIPVPGEQVNNNFRNQLKVNAHKEYTNTYDYLYEENPLQENKQDINNIFDRLLYSEAYLQGYIKGYRDSKRIKKKRAH